ncbi:hypothetical protein BHM03_00016979 [Ensete ventricosum]|nr:hypothetical protein BHM03_00016979 [Ensete ventricosum]
MIKYIEESEEEVQEPEEENMKEEPQPADCMTHALAGHTNSQVAKVEESLKPQPVTVLIKTRSTNNFMNSKVAAQLMHQNKDCSRFDVEVAYSQILKYDQRCPRVKLLWQNQEILAYFFLLPLDDYEAMLDIKWLTMLDNVLRNFFKFIMKIFSYEKKEILREKRESDVTTICTQETEKVLNKVNSGFLM